ncbi:hypothetical protein PPYR_07913 [Photinus pyralis]|uniref:Uncharacterized protein n=1 Tax=Photinus pyralis TaxID=7054 RepID=A0A5N4ARX2_PHOPY|nr:protein chibby homolog 1 [Photinus pyralis]KAB0800033.1 hypothetical protein PPYR_07913 [Photinus pyralis]
MPFFNNKFSPKKSKLRKSALSLNNENLEDLIEDDRTVKLQLGEHKINFCNGRWESGSEAAKDTYKMNQKCQATEEENNLLKLKIQILLNMLTQATAENNLQQRELSRLKK